ncbi:MAG: alpha/beta fold hydrolase [Polyangiales bacterium]
MTPVLLLRPLGGTIELWGTFRERLSERSRVVAFDPPARASTRAMARDAALVLDSFGIERAHVFGLSLGGMVATWLAVDHPARVDRLILASTMPWGLGVRYASPRRAWSLARTLTRPAGERDAWMVRRILSSRFAAEHPAEVEHHCSIARAHPIPLASTVTLLAAAARHDARAVLPRIAAPTLVLAGSRDRLAVPHAQRRLARAIPGARYEEIDAGHDLTLEAPLETAARVAAFVDQ